jgi:hypothetical protein
MDSATAYIPKDRRLSPYSNWFRVTIFDLLCLASELFSKGGWLMLCDAICQNYQNIYNRRLCLILILV